MFSCLFDGDVYMLHSDRVFRPDVYKAPARTYRVGGNDHTFNHPVWVTFKQSPVHERARIALISIADEIFFIARRFSAEIPFHPCRESRSSSASKTRFDHLIYNLLRFCFSNGLYRGDISAPFDKIFNTLGVDLPAVFQHEPFLPTVKINVRDVRCESVSVLDKTLNEISIFDSLGDDLINIIRGHSAVEIVVWLNHNHRRFGTHANTSSLHYCNLLIK